VFAHMAVPQKLNALSSLLGIDKPELASSFKKEIRGQVEKAQEERNKVFHQKWFAARSQSGPVVGRMSTTARKSLTMSIDLISLTELIKNQRFMERVASELREKILLPLSQSPAHKKGRI
jgi:hypothetical protein